ncbi:MAG: hypothetical protein ACLFR1_15315 [Spirochaetia bacterium]
MSIFEALMLICFGSAWPFSIYTSLRSKSTKGKSLLFMCVILTGYVSGVFHKIFFSFDLIILLYALNAAMVSVDIILYFRNKSIEAHSLKAS